MITTAKLSQFFSSGRPVRSNEVLVGRDAQVERDIVTALRNWRNAKFAAVPQSWVITHPSSPYLINASLQLRWQQPSIVTAWEIYLQIVTCYTFLLWRHVHYLYIGIHGIIYCSSSIQFRPCKPTQVRQLADVQLRDYPTCYKTRQDNECRRAQVYPLCPHLHTIHACHFTPLNTNW